MASHGINDKVAIVGIGCRKLGERWDKSTLGMTHNLGGRPGTCVSFISIVGKEEG
jgi:hypothetical protein